MNLSKQIQAALGQQKADLVIKNASVLNVFTEQFEKTDVAVTDGVIVGLGSYEGEEEIDAKGKTLVPGFIDGHVHLESSIISPKQYCKTVVPHGTTAVVTDPHEITNVLGKTGFYYMIEETRELPIDVYFMVPSCVPATPFDEAGAVIDSADVAEMLAQPNVLGLAEMMNYPGVLAGNEDVLKKIELAQKAGKVIDGHAPGLTGKSLNAYVAAGVYSDHECTNAVEAIEKFRLGQYIMIRNGTAARNLDALIPLLQKPYCDRCLFVTDDIHPAELIRKGHIDHIIRKAIAGGADPVCAYKVASYNAANYFGLKKNGAIAPGYAADFVLLDDIETVKINSVYKKGQRVDKNVKEIVDSIDRKNPYEEMVNSTVKIGSISAENFKLKKAKEKVIQLHPYQLLTSDAGYASDVDLDNDICKLAVIERHHNSGNMGVAFVKGYGLKRGAVATTVAHDSHNVIVAGVNDADMAFAVEKLKELGGGMVVVEDGEVLGELALPIAGLMCNLDVTHGKEKMEEVLGAAYSLGISKGIAPFMTLSFASLPVIPELRLTTKGVVDVNKFVLLD